MAAAAKKGRHHSRWSSDTAITSYAALFLFALTGAVDLANGPHEQAPQYLTAACGLAAAWLFRVIGTDRDKREHDVANDARTAKQRAADVNETALTAEAKADRIAEVISEARPDLADRMPPPMIEQPKNKPGGDTP